ncbi:MAG: ornithine carbamoyltransferase [Actinomycetia bacterium]|jgi:ornithine carbamoyltransferase|nr:ornithine carbamoyltransferase [Actinomycetes bacterium]
MAVAPTPMPPEWPALYGRDCLRLADFDAADVLGLVRLGRELKQLHQLRVPFEPLRGATLAMIFEKPSTRTRVSFAVGMQQLGGQALELSPSMLQLSRGETLEDTARVLSRYVNAIMVRTGPQANLEALAAAAAVPVINGLSDAFHPCQTLADLLTLYERFGYLRGLAVAYIGDGGNMAASWLEAAALLGMGLRVATPPGYEPDPDLVAWAKQQAELSGAGIHLTHDPHEAVAGADVVYTDVWVSMGQEAEAAARRQAFAPYQVNRLLMQIAGPNAIFMHCLPAHRGEEVTDEVLDGPQSCVWDQAENRLHAQKALLLSLLAPRHRS